MTSADFLFDNPLGRSVAELDRREGHLVFKNFLPINCDPVWPQALGKIARDAPWRYWSPVVVSKAMEVLGADVDRTIAALNVHARAIDIGLTEWLRHAPVADHEDALPGIQTTQLIRLATEYHPEYGRRAEHVLANLLRLYWAILRRGSVDAAFDLRGALALLRSRDCQALTSGYVDDIRNAVTHGDVVFRGFGIQYGWSGGRRELTAGDFLHEFDQVWTTSSSLAFALLLFLARLGTGSLTALSPVPLRISLLLATAAACHPGFTLSAAVESDYPATGPQLHIAVRTSLRRRVAALCDCARLSAFLIRYGATCHRRHVFDISYEGRQLTSMVIVNTQKLSNMLTGTLDMRLLADVFDEPILLWYDQNRLSIRWSALRLNLPVVWQLVRDGVRAELQKASAFSGAWRYRIRNIENRSVGRVIRVHVTAVLRNSSDAASRITLRAILKAIVDEVRSRRFRSEQDDTVAVNLPWRARPKYVWVSLFRQDATLRELGRGGWIGGNLVAVGEWLAGQGRAPILVPRPEEEHFLIEG